jgi:hypothetical protein
VCSRSHSIQSDAPIILLAPSERLRTEQSPVGFWRVPSNSNQERKKPCLIESLFPWQPPLLAFRALLPMPQPVVAKAVVPPVGRLLLQAAGPLPKRPQAEFSQAAVTSQCTAPQAAVTSQYTAPLAVFPKLSLPLAVPQPVEHRERDTMHPHPITALLLVDAIPIHPAIKYPPGEDDGG